MTEKILLPLFDEPNGTKVTAYRVSGHLVVLCEHPATAEMRRHFVTYVPAFDCPSTHGATEAEALERTAEMIAGLVEAGP